MSKRPAVPSPAPSATRNGGAAWQRLLTAQQKIVLRNEPLARRGSVKALHDLRVALRRIRTLCATFHDLSPTALTQLERSAAKVGDRMGNARDLDVWIELLKSLMRANGSADLSPREQRAIIRTLQEERTRQEAALALDCASFQRTKTLIDKLANQRRYRTTSASRDAFAARLCFRFAPSSKNAIAKSVRFPKNPPTTCAGPDAGCATSRNFSRMDSARQQPKPANGLSDRKPRLAASTIATTP